MVARYVFAISTGTVVTLALLYVMQSLVLLQQPPADTTPRPRFFLEPVRLAPPPPPPPVHEHGSLKDPLPPVPGYRGPAIPVDKVTQLPGLPTRPGVPAGPPRPDVGLPSDTPLIRVASTRPAYPQRAIDLEMEGWVIVAFDVAANGTVTNATVVASSDALFEKPALESVRRFRYRARVVDGVPQPTTGLRNRFVFRMDDL